MPRINTRSGRTYWSAPIRRPQLPGDELFRQPDPEVIPMRTISRAEFEAEKAWRRRIDDETARQARVWWRRLWRLARKWARI